jgi:hypothetical protein
MSLTRAIQSEDRQKKFNGVICEFFQDEIMTHESYIVRRHERKTMLGR